MSMPLPSERLSFLSSEEWVLRSPELAVGRASIAPFTQRVIYEHDAPFGASEFPLISEEWVIRSPELCDRLLSLIDRASLAPLTIEG